MKCASAPSLSMPMLPFPPFAVSDVNSLIHGASCELTQTCSVCFVRGAMEQPTVALIIERGYRSYSLPLLNSFSDL
jgi:hypothetical protein